MCSTTADGVDEVCSLTNAPGFVAPIIVTVIGPSGVGRSAVITIEGPLARCSDQPHTALGFGGPFWATLWTVRSKWTLLTALSLSLVARGAPVAAGMHAG